ncbi:anthranilate synthase component II [Phaeocystidibacter marisrubri]|uniref:Aminodeoxychorismate/anthranilate synthase component II n=1 Tax=Phaeocystidibacter marisrubri TaxID=1577780 RepID=A0A6L3ZHN8_9FLAO|nr:aminodeoxychorismate/anthranilate synthase component II [Phaeocystidibacter marisrubri]KAB2817371.1 aminodeoxychorismate/anthranilate synthase component II [Phaeocystidibacter marisrubri]GGH75681.1 aminodeoxychorismate/anthranilate synthase component II [Phaeocystidibacter marisrubri]
MKMLLIDNYDSFTFNLVHDLERVSTEVSVQVLRNDALEGVDFTMFDRIVLSPGPGLPSESGALMSALEEIRNLKIPVLGICLGLQAMVEITGGRLYNLKSVRHGVPFTVELSDSNLFAEIPHKTEVGLYHSWAAVESELPADWKVLGRSEEGVIMAIQHTTLPWVAFQFHPESILTKFGRVFLSNWVTTAPVCDSART